jgi:hypothetical protein
MIIDDYLWKHDNQLLIENGHFLTHNIHFMLLMIILVVHHDRNMDDNDRVIT